MTDAARELVIRPRAGWEGIDLFELWTFRELFGFLVWRDIKIRYKQTFLGGLWALLQPVMGTLVFGGLLRRVAVVDVGGAPYMLFVYAGLALWMFFANSVAQAGNSMIAGEHLIRKVYFPRFLLPLASIAGLGMDLLIALAFTLGLIAWYGRPLPATLLLAPVFAGGTFLCAGGIGMFLAALNVRFRDVKYAVPFLLQLGLFATPVIYPLGRVPGKLQVVLALNPMAAMVEGWRNAALGAPIAWRAAWISVAAGAALFCAGLMFFHRMERRFADVI